MEISIAGTKLAILHAKGRQAHGVCRVKFAILECGQRSEVVNHHWRKLCPLNINLIAQYDVYLTGKRTYDPLQHNVIPSSRHYCRLPQEALPYSQEFRA